MTDGPFRLDGRTALITGGAGHVGREIADALAERGAAVRLVDLETSRVAAVAGELADARGADVTAVVCNLESESERATLVERVVEDEALDILVHTAALVGTTPLPGWCVPFEQQSLDTWRRAFEVNLTACFDLCSRLAPLLRQSGHGSIVTIGSIYGEFAPDMRLYDGAPQMGNPAAYGASKAGLIQLTKYMSTVLAPDVRCNALALGGLSRGQPESFVRAYEARVPLGRMGTEGDIRGPTLFLASDMSAYVTGQTLFVDGGFGVW